MLAQSDFITRHQATSEGIILGMKTISAMVLCWHPCGPRYIPCLHAYSWDLTPFSTGIFLYTTRHAQFLWQRITRWLGNTSMWVNGCYSHKTSIILTHWGRDKMAAVSQTTLSNAFFWNENVRISIKISLKFVPKGPINNIPALVQKMAWCRPGDKPLSEPMMV